MTLENLLFQAVQTKRHPSTGSASDECCSKACNAMDSASRQENQCSMTTETQVTDVNLPVLASQQDIGQQP